MIVLFYCREIAEALREATDILRRVAPETNSPFSSPRKTPNRETGLLETLRTINKHLFAASKQAPSTPTQTAAPASSSSGGMWGKLAAGFTAQALPSPPSTPPPVTPSAPVTASSRTPGSGGQVPYREVIKLKNDIMHEVCDAHC
jgi:hypothetical protein